MERLAAMAHAIMCCDVFEGFVPLESGASRMKRVFHVGAFFVDGVLIDRWENADQA